MPNIDNYHLSVTAGPSRDPSTHKPVPVNTEKAMHFDTEHISTDLYIRIQGFRNDEELPSTSPYFSTAPHSTNKDKYSISFAPLIFKNKSVNGDDLVLGNDFDHPISKNLPPGFNLAWRVARWVVDPGLDGDPWADKPWMEGRVLSSVNVLDVGEREKTKGEVDVLAEGLAKKKIKNVKGAEDSGGGEEEGIPEDSAARMKLFVDQEKRKGFTFEKGEKYWTDFFNPYLDFNEFALHLPGISIHILKYWDGQPLRYVLRNRVDGTVYLVIQFTLVPKDDAEDEDEEEEDESSQDEIDETAAKDKIDSAKNNTADDDVD